MVRVLSEFLELTGTTQKGFESITGVSQQRVSTMATRVDVFVDYDMRTNLIRKVWSERVMYRGGDEKIA